MAFVKINDKFYQRTTLLKYFERDGKTELHQFILKCEDSKDEAEKSEENKKADGYWLKLRTAPGLGEKFADEVLNNENIS